MSQEYAYTCFENMILDQLSAQNCRTLHDFCSPAAIIKSILHCSFMLNSKVAMTEYRATAKMTIRDGFRSRGFTTFQEKFSKISKIFS